MRRCWKKYLLIGAVLTASLTVGKDSWAATSNRTKIHFISLYGMTDAILLESNGHYGMVDSGEDWDYPTGTEKDKYPYRYGITTDEGYEQQVIHYLNELGVKKLDFYIATHAHSDHIGSGDEIIEHFPVERLYIGRYADEYQLDAHGKDTADPYYYENADESILWDNQYVYDKIIQAAEENNVRIITDLDLEKNAGYRKIRMGNMNISIMNYERKRDEDGNIIPVVNENDNSLVVKVSAYGRNALLTSDLDPADGDTGKIADEVVSRLWRVYGIKDENAQYTESRDESKPNQGKRIKIDLLKLAHHGISYNNTNYFLTSLNPVTTIITGPEEWFDSRMRSDLPDTKVYSTMTDSAAVVAEFSFSGISTEYVKIGQKWEMLDGEYYYFDDNGRVTTSWQNINHVWYYFNKKGVMQTGWQYDSGRWYYLDDSGAMQTGWQQIADAWYYFESNGAMQTGWKEVNGSWYYFDGAGEMVTAWQKINGNWYYFDENGRMVTSWQKIDDVWYYFSDGGAMQTGWQSIGNIWYYFDAGGTMQTGWQSIGNIWYYFDAGGTMQTGWQSIANNWYYFEGSGTMDHDMWVQSVYYLKASGAMAVSEWVDNDRYYVDEQGIWVPGI